MAVTILRVQIHEREVEVGCYGSDADWVCRLTDPSSQLARHNDAYCPPPDLGFVWFLESDNKWLASGLVNREVFRDADSVSDLLYQISKEAMRRNDQLAWCIEFVGAEFIAIFDGEEGPAECPGDWQESRWWQPRSS